MLRSPGLGQSNRIMESMGNGDILNDLLKHNVIRKFMIIRSNRSSHEEVKDGQEPIRLDVQLCAAGRRVKQENTMELAGQQMRLILQQRAVYEKKVRPKIAYEDI